MDPTRAPHLTPVEPLTDPAAIRAAAQAEHDRHTAAWLAEARRSFLAAQLLGQFEPHQVRHALIILGTDERRAAQLTAEATALFNQAGAV